MNTKNKPVTVAKFFLHKEICLGRIDYFPFHAGYKFIPTFPGKRTSYKVRQFANDCIPRYIKRDKNVFRVDYDVPFHD